MRQLSGRVERTKGSYRRIVAENWRISIEMSIAGAQLDTSEVIGHDHAMFAAVRGRERQAKRRRRTVSDNYHGGERTIGQTGNH